MKTIRERALTAIQMVSSSEFRIFAMIVGVFLVAYYAPFESPRVSGAILESFYMLQDYAREHVLFCLVPAFFIAGAIGNFVSQQAVLKYFGAQAKKWVSYSVASVWDCARRMLLHCPTPFLRHLQERSRHWTGHRLFVLRPGY